MPLYDYRCNDCQKRFTAMVGVVADGKLPACPKCASGNLTKLIGQIGRLRSEDEVLDDLADLDRVGDMDDPKQMKKWVREMGKAMDEDLGDEFEEMLEAEESGEGGDGAQAGGPDSTIY